MDTERIDRTAHTFEGFMAFIGLSVMTGLLAPAVAMQKASDFVAGIEAALTEEEFEVFADKAVAIMKSFQGEG